MEAKDIKRLVRYDAIAGELTITDTKTNKSIGYCGSIANEKLTSILMENDDNTEIVMTDNETAYRRKLNRTLHYHLTARAVNAKVYMALLSQYGVESSTQLDISMLEELIEDVKCLQTPEDVRKERSGILHILSKLGIRGSAEDGWEAVNAYLSSPRIAGKRLYEMTYEELIMCNRKLRTIYYKTNKEPLMH
jgi:hypothetical protein